MNKLLALLFTFWAFTSCGHSLKEHSSESVTNLNTINHRNFPGTKVFIDLPTEYKVSKSLPAFLKGEDAVIHAIDLVGGNFYKNAATFTKEKFEQNGLKVFDFREFEVNNYPAKMVMLQIDQENKMYSVIFGDSTFSATISGVYALNDTETENLIEKAVHTTYYDKKFKVDPFEIAIFQLDDTKSLFKFSNFSASFYTYTLKGEKKEPTEVDPRFSVGTRPLEGKTLQEIADESSSFVINATIKNVALNKVNGLESFKRTIYGDINGKPSVLFQHIVIIDESAIVMRGIAVDNFERYISEFENLANTIKIK